MFRIKYRKRITKLPEDIEVSTPCYQCQGLPHPHRDQVAGGQDEVDDVEWSQDYHHEQHAVDGEVPMKISKKIVYLKWFKNILTLP